MNIIKQGDVIIANLKAGRIKEFSCRYCGCVFEANINEYHLHSQYNRFWCSCPCCDYPALENKKGKIGAFSLLKNIFFSKH